MYVHIYIYPYVQWVAIAICIMYKISNNGIGRPCDENKLVSKPGSKNKASEASEASHLFNLEADQREEPWL